MKFYFRYIFLRKSIFQFPFTLGGDFADANNNVDHGGENISFECPFCDQSKSDLIDVQNHIDTEHPEIPFENGFGTDVLNLTSQINANETVEALQAQAKEQEQQILQKDQDIALLERKIDALMVENRNLVAIADEKDEKFRQMEKRIEKLEEEEKAKAKVCNLFWLVSLMGFYVILYFGRSGHL